MSGRYPKGTLFSQNRFESPEAEDYNFQQRDNYYSGRDFSFIGSNQYEDNTEAPLQIHNPGHQPVIRTRNIDLEKPQTGSRQRKNEFEPYLNGDYTNISQYTAANVEYPKRPHKIQKLNEDQDEKKANITTLMKSMPFSYEDLQLPEWFDATSIHEIEFIALPELQNNEDEAIIEDYKNYRNYMIETYKANPDYYLTISACKSKLDADLVTLIRIHNFLEMHGLINSRSDPRRRIFDPYIDSDPTAQISPKSQRNYKNIGDVNFQQLRDLIYNEKIVPAGRSSWDLTIEDPYNPDGRKIFNCCSCKSDCSEIRYQSLKAKNFQVCIDCFLEGRFPANFFSGEFLRVEGGDSDITTDEKWTNEEILRLLEGVDRYDDDWLLISEHVGSRSKEQCVTQFLQLPIDDEFLTAQLTKAELEELPFGELPNPVMTMIAFLTGHVNPGVGAAAAKSALKTLMKAQKSVDKNMKEETQKQEETEDIEIDTSMDDENKSIDIANGVEDEVHIKPEYVEENMRLNEQNLEAFSKVTMKEATTSALKSAVGVAHKLANYEDQEIQHWTRLAVKTMVDKLVIKLQQYDELEVSLETEYQELIKQQNTLAESVEGLSTQHYPLNGAVEENSVIEQQFQTIQARSTDI